MLEQYMEFNEDYLDFPLTDNYISFTVEDN